MRTFRCRGGLSVGVALLLAAATAGAFEPAENKSAIGQKAFFLPELYITTSNAPVASVIDQLPNRAAWNQLLAANKGAAARVTGFIEPALGHRHEHHRRLPAAARQRRGQLVTLERLRPRLGRPVTPVDEARRGGPRGRVRPRERGVLGIDPAQLGR